MFKYKIPMDALPPPQKDAEDENNNTTAQWQLAYYLPTLSLLLL